MGFNTVITGLSSAFINKFGEALTFYPSASVVAGDSVSVNGIWDAGAEEGRQQEFGDGLQLEKPGGRRLRRMIVLELDTTWVEANVDENADPPQVFKRDSGGQLVQVKRITGRDRGMTSLVCFEIVEDRSRKPERRG